MKAFTPFPANIPSNIADITQIANAVRIAEIIDINVQEPLNDRELSGTPRRVWPHPTESVYSHTSTDLRKIGLLSDCLVAIGAIAADA